MHHKNFILLSSLNFISYYSRCHAIGSTVNEEIYEYEYTFLVDNVLTVACTESQCLYGDDNNDVL